LNLNPDFVILTLEKFSTFSTSFPHKMLKTQFYPEKLLTFSTSFPHKTVENLVLRIFISKSFPHFQQVFHIKCGNVEMWKMWKTFFHEFSTCFPHTIVENLDPINPVNNGILASFQHIDIPYYYYISLVIVFVFTKFFSKIFLEDK